MIRTLFHTLAAVLLVSSFIGAAKAADVFVSGFEDLPLMNGLTQIQQESVLFDTPQGRIVQASATGMVTREAVLTFYRETLPQLGWIAIDGQTYRREGEVLRLEFSDRDRALVVQFLAEPSGAEAP